VNLAGLGQAESFMPGVRLPSGRELARYLAGEFHYPDAGADSELVRIAQWIYTRLGPDDLYECLHEVFDNDFRPTAVHELLAALPKWVRDNGVVTPEGLEQPLIITTNYDDALERAFQARGEEFDLLTYIAKGQLVGKFLHTAPGQEQVLVEDANRYQAISLRERPCILKLHGAVRRSGDARDDNYVVTEDDYIECLTRTRIVDFLPPAVVIRMQRHFLFLGYSMRDWNLRAMLHRIRQDADGGFSHSWVVQQGIDDLEVRAWQHRHVEMFDMDLRDFSERLAEALGIQLGATVES
jgi:hypothetical protein